MITMNITAPAGSGKTLLIETLCPILMGLGYRIKATDDGILRFQNSDDLQIEIVSTTI